MFALYRVKNEKFQLITITKHHNRKLQNHCLLLCWKITSKISRPGRIEVPWWWWAELKYFIGPRDTATFYAKFTWKLKIKSSSRWKVTDKNVDKIHMGRVRRWMNFPQIAFPHILIIIMCTLSYAHINRFIVCKGKFYSRIENIFRNSAIFSPETRPLCVLHLLLSQ